MNNYNITEFKPLNDKVRYIKGLIHKHKYMK